MTIDLGMFREQVQQRPVFADRFAAKVVDEVMRVFTADVATEAPSSPPRT
jgi:hypothetical protein